MGSLSGSLDEFGNRRILEWFEEVHWEARETGANLFRQGQNICWCRKVGQDSDEVNDDDVSQPDQVTVQPEPRPMVG